jgi:SAM-dependent methyltransferase
VPWSDHTSCLFCAVGRFFRPGYHNNLVSNWLPALDGVAEKRKRGAKVADVGCGHGWSTVIMARALPNSQFVGYDFHPSSSKATPRRRGWFLLNTRRADGTDPFVLLVVTHALGRSCTVAFEHVARKMGV